MSPASPCKKESASLFKEPPLKRQCLDTEPSQLVNQVECSLSTKPHTREIKSDPFMSDKAREPKDQVDSSNLNQSDDSNEDDSDGEKETVDVDFDFNDPKEIDFHGIKTLLQQTFVEEADRVDVSAFSDLIISQKSVGSTVKADGNVDPYALLTAINMTHHAELACVQHLREYLLEKSRKNTNAHATLERLFSNKNEHLAIVFNERLINMPPQISLPMFKMLAEELEWAQDEDQPFKFSHLIFISKVYKEVESTLDKEISTIDETEIQANGSMPAPQKKKKMKKSETPMFYFQPEDELIEKYAELSIDYKLAQKQSTDSRRAFHDLGIMPSRRILVVKMSKFCNIINDMEDMLA
ncbi:Mss4p nuclear export [Batrachochytrium dendrobatidis]|nr:Mss4p nuclear export [Batrachochytrium dendrobatidis]